MGFLGRIDDDPKLAEFYRRKAGGIAVFAGSLTVLNLLTGELGLAGVSAITATVGAAAFVVVTHRGGDEWTSS